MDELYMRWEEAVEAGETTEDFESWYSGLVAAAEDRAQSLYGD